MHNSHLKVAIIGAGPAGLVATRHLSESPNLQVTVFEVKDDIGGLWCYDEKNEADPHFDSHKSKDPYYQFYGNYHASMYPHLQSNLPYFMDAFKDLIHPELDENFPIYFNIAQQKNYLDAYAAKFDLRKLVEFNTLVKSIRLYQNLSSEDQAKAPEQRRFIVQTSSSQENKTQYHAFDYVVIATGEHSKPYVPSIEGIEKFKGRIVNAKDFRHPNADYLKDRKIMVIGSSFSATDICVQLLDNPYVGPQPVEKITLVGRKLFYLEKSEDLKPFIERGKLSIIVSEIKQVLNENTIQLADGSTHEVDTLILGTGYQYTFPFLDLEKDKIIDHNPENFRGKFFGPLYKRFIPIREPNLFFLGMLNAGGLLFSINEIHAMLIKNIIEGKIKLPSKEKMVQSFLTDLDDIRFKHKVPLENTLLTPLAMDVGFWMEMKDWLEEVHGGDKKKREEFDSAMVKAYQKMGEIFFAGNIMSVKKFDYNTIFPRSLKNSTEFA